MIDIIEEGVRNDFSLFESLESNVRSYCRDFPTVFNRACNSRVVDENGRSYIDFLSGAGSLNYGHNNPVIKEAILEYIKANGIIHGLDLYTTAKRNLIGSFERHILAPRNLRYKMQFTGPTGTNAVEAALKLARKVTGRTNVIAFSNAFHGMSLGSLAATTNPSKRQGAGAPLGGVTFMPYDGYLGPDVDAFDVMARMVAPGGGIDAPAAFLFEPIQGEGGLRVASARWAGRLEALARSLGALVVVDDIQAGCGRSGRFFSFEGLGISPDIVCLSKSLSAYGLPMALTLIKPELDVWKPGEHNGTFRGNNLAFVSARAAIETYWSSPRFEKALAEKIGWLADRLEQTACRAAERDPGARVVGRGFMQGIAFSDGRAPARICAEAFRRGLIVETCGVHDQVVKLLPPLTIERDDLEEGVAHLESAIDHVLFTEGR